MALKPEGDALQAPYCLQVSIIPRLRRKNRVRPQRFGAIDDEAIKVLTDSCCSCFAAAFDLVQPGLPVPSK